MKQLLAFLPLIVFYFTANAQNLAGFNALVKAKDTVAQKALLDKWEKKGVNDPDYYIAGFNFYANQSRKSLLSLETQQNGEKSLALKDSANNTAGYMNERIMYDAAGVAKALAYINKGIAKFPNRLDMRFGKTHLLGKAENYKDFTAEIVAALEYSVKIKNKWMWSENKPLDNPQGILLESTHTYYVQLYNTEDDGQIDNMERIAETAVKYYPNDVILLSDLSIAYMLKKDYGKAIIAMLKAEKLDPKDTIVLGNIAHAYEMKGDTKNAKKYYELLLSYGDEETKAFAKEKLGKLK